MNMEITDLFAKFARIGELMHRQRHWNHRAHGPAGDPHRGQGRVMALLKMQPEISQKELSYLLDIRPQSLGELLAKLERGGYIERSPSASDRRGMDIKLTEAGLAAAEQSAAAEESFTSLSREEQAALGGYLDKIIAELEQSQGARRADSGCDCGGPHEHRHEHGEEHGRPHGKECRARHHHGMAHGHGGHGREEGCGMREHGEDGFDARPHPRHGHGGPRHGRGCGECSDPASHRGRGGRHGSPDSGEEME